MIGEGGRFGRWVSFGTLLSGYILLTSRAASTKSLACRSQSFDSERGLPFTHSSLQSVVVSIWSWLLKDSWSLMRKDYSTLSYLRCQVYLRSCYLLGAGFTWILRFEDLVKFFQSPSFRLNEEKVNEDKLEEIPEDEENVKPVSNLEHVK